ncbi:bacterial extracellular solute-binding s, 5 Middle family protein, partial [Chlamydia psittaci 84-8471/1]
LNNQINHQKNAKN